MNTKTKDMAQMVANEIAKGQGKMKKVMLFDTALATSNLGDEIILKSVQDGLSQVLYESMCFRLATHIENYSPIQMLYPGKQLSNICLNADLKFVAGTNLLSSNLFRIRPQWWVNWLNKRIYHDAILVGVGTTNDVEYSENKYTYNLYRYILSSRYIHSVRDEKTKRFVESLGLKAINTGCPTLWGLTEEECKKIPKKKANNIIFSVSGYEDQINVKYDRKMIECLFREYEKKYVWIQTTHDEEYLNCLLSEDELEKVQKIYSLRKFDYILNQGDIDYVGTRLHGGIYALQHHIRSLIVAIDHRAKGFAEANNLPIIQRENIDSLRSLIINEFDTKIYLNSKAIQIFIRQFL